jgi:hypothetical protein
MKDVTKQPGSSSCVSGKVPIGVSYRQEALDDDGYPQDEGLATIVDAGLDGNVRRLAGPGQPLISRAEISQCCPLEAIAGELVQQRDDAFLNIDQHCEFGSQGHPECRRFQRGAFPCRLKPLQAPARS